MHYTSDDLLFWWVDGFVSKGRDSIDFWNEKSKFSFYRIYEIIANRIGKLEDEDSTDNEFYRNLVKFSLFFRQDELNGNRSLENALRNFAGVDKAKLYLNGEDRINFTYSKDSAKHNLQKIPEEYRDFIETISDVMVN